MSTRDVGTEAERRAERFLTEKGYVVLARNFRAKGGEIDLIARDRDVVCFVEVRSRASKTHGTAAETVGGIKQRRIILTAQLWLTKHRWTGGCRFDVVAIHGADIELIKDAFRVS